MLTYMFVCLGLALAVFVVGACCTKSDYGEQMAEYRGAFKCQRLH